MDCVRWWTLPTIKAKPARLQLAGIFAKVQAPTPVSASATLSTTREKFGEKMLPMYIRDNISSGIATEQNERVRLRADSNSAKTKALSSYILKLWSPRQRTTKPS